jgi:hypothetical protein
LEQQLQKIQNLTNKLKYAIEQRQQQIQRRQRNQGEQEKKKQLQQLQISDKFDEIISTNPENSEWIPPADTPNYSLVLKMRQKLGDWETLFRYLGKKTNFSSGCIDPVLILIFLHEKQDVKSFLDVRMGAAGPLAVAFTYFSFRIYEGIQDVFKLFGTENLLQKFVKALAEICKSAHLTAISTIARMKSKSLAG